MAVLFFSGSLITNVLIALISLLIIHNFMLSSGLKSSSYKLEEEEDRLDFYCNIEGMSAIDVKDSEEGYLKSPILNNEWELDKLVIALRHGDRTKLHTLPSTKDLFRDDKYISRSVLNNLKAIKDKSILKIKIIEESSEVLDKDKYILKTLSNPELLEKGDFDLDIGQLTTRGIKQHLMIGGELRKRYHRFLIDNDINPNKISIRSTLYQRTILSVASFMSTFLPNVVFSMDNEELPVYVHALDYLEVMHGVATVPTSSSDSNSDNNAEVKVSVQRDEEIKSLLKFNSHFTPDLPNKLSTSTPTSAIIDVLKGCPRAKTLSFQERQSFRTNSDVITALEHAFPNSLGQGLAWNLTMTETADSVLPFYCHRNPLPIPVTSTSTTTTTTTTTRKLIETKTEFEANSDSHNHIEGDHKTETTRQLDGDSSASATEVKVRDDVQTKTYGWTNSLVQRVMQEADRVFCTRYTGSNGGLAGTRLALYPFLAEIMNNLANIGVNNSDNSDNDTKKEDSLLDLGNRNNKKLYMYSGHDTVIAPVLAALGVYDSALLSDHQSCKWPKYASRIVFELWRKKKKNVMKNREKEKEEEEENDIKKDDPAVRVLYNGRAVTADIPACKAHFKAKEHKRRRILRDEKKHSNDHHRQHDHDHDHHHSYHDDHNHEHDHEHDHEHEYERDTGELCPMSVLIDQVESLLDGKSFDSACAQ